MSEHLLTLAFGFVLASVLFGGGDGSDVNTNWGRGVVTGVGIIVIGIGAAGLGL